jgi:hypothetical protein
MLDQKLNTPFQQVWVAKLLGFEIHYKEGSSNLVVDALSRKTSVEIMPLVLSNACPDLLESIKLSWQQDSSLNAIILDLQRDPKSRPKFFWVRGELRMKGKLVVGPNSDVKLSIFK